jgi:hypothetical protein
MIGMTAKWKNTSSIIFRFKQLCDSWQLPHEGLFFTSAIMQETQSFIACDNLRDKVQIIIHCTDEHNTEPHVITTFLIWCVQQMWFTYRSLLKIKWQPQTKILTFYSMYDPELSRQLSTIQFSRATCVKCLNGEKTNISRTISKVPWGWGQRWSSKRWFFRHLTTLHSW